MKDSETLYYLWLRYTTAVLGLYLKKAERHSKNEIEEIFRQLKMLEVETDYSFRDDCSVEELIKDVPILPCIPNLKRYDLEHDVKIISFYPDIIKINKICEQKPLRNMKEFMCDIVKEVR